MASESVKSPFPASRSLTNSRGRNPDLSAEKETIQDIPPSHRHFIYNEAPSSSTSLDTKPKNVILFGETGTGKSSVINLMAARNIASVSPDMEGCTLEATAYSFTLSSPEMSLRIFDTVGLEEPEMGVNTFFGAIEKAHQLITTLHNSGGIDLLLLCIRGGRLTNTVQRNYRLFFEILCDKRVPLAIVVTHLEHEDVMEDWWVRNKDTFERYDIRSVAHACITALPAYVTLYMEKRIQSRNTLRKLFHDALSSPNPPYLQIIRNWLTAFVEKFWLLLTSWMSFEKGDVTRKLEVRCGFSRDEAQRLAEIITRRDT